MAAREVTLALQQPLCPQDLGISLSEVLKYVLYTRNQIPLPYDQLLKAKTAASIKSQGKESGYFTAAPSKPQATSWQEKRFHDKIQKLQSLLSSFQCVCAKAGSSVREVIFVLGATLVSPKTTYRIVIDDALVRKDASSLTGENLRRYTVKNLVSIGMETDDKQISQTNCCVLLLAPRWVVTGFGRNALPRMTFKVMPRGSHTNLRLSLSDHTITNCKPTERPKTINHSAKEQEHVEEGDEESSELASHLNNLQLSDSAESRIKPEQDSDYIWYQIPTIFSGLSELPHNNKQPPKSTSNPSDDIWG